MDETYKIRTRIKGVDLLFRTADGVFSPRAVDKGTLAMLEHTEFKPEDRVLDLGCGYGVVGILAALLLGPENVVMLDKDPAAVELARENAERNGVKGIKWYVSDGFREFPEKDFTLILSNPPYHTDFSVAREFIEKGFNRLQVGGRMLMVTKRDLWYRNKLTAIFGSTRVWEQDGYYVFSSIKKSSSYANTKNRKEKPKP